MAINKTSARGEQQVLYRADLHTHSTASDGQYTPSELVRMAKERGLEFLALTDHDTTDGLAEAVQAGNALGVRVIRGIELSAKEYHTFHILGYNIEPAAQKLAELCHDMKISRDERSLRILAFLKEKGMEISLSEVEALTGGSIVGRPHFAQVLTRHGFVASNREAFDRYLDTEEFHQQVERSKPSVRTCIDAIKSAGGKASLAHPYQIGLSDEALDRLVGQLASCGLDAIECRYSKHTPEQCAFYLHLAEKYHLQVSGGSDFHGEHVKPDVQLVAYRMDLDWLL